MQPDYLMPKVPKHGRIEKDTFPQSIPELVIFTKERQCCNRGPDCFGDIVAHHLKADIPEAWKGGVGKKGSDRGVVPMCVGCHRRVHDLGHWEFQRRTGVNLRRVCDENYCAWPGRIKWEKK